MDRFATRYNIYGNIHKALRAYLSQVLQQVGCADWDDDLDRAQALVEVRGLLSMCRAHLEHENDFVHTAMEARRPGSATAAAEEHLHHVDAIDTLLARASALEPASASQRAGQAHALYLALAMFVAENHQHMDMEERRHNAILWDSYSDDEIHGIEAALVASMPPEASMLTVRWMLPNIAHPERVALLSGMRRHAPAEVFRAVIGLAASLLSSRDNAKLQAALGLGEIPAQAA
jgi:hypothetical protein